MALYAKVKMKKLVGVSAECVKVAPHIKENLKRV